MQILEKLFQKIQFFVMLQIFYSKYLYYNFKKILLNPTNQNWLI